MKQESKIYTLEKAREYEKEKLNKIPEKTRPVFHISSPVGWINDPNGFSEYQGEYHLFYQYHPYSTVWGPMHWGHSKTKDFIKWEQLPVALAPDQSYDGQGCFSGSAVEYHGKHILMYTSVEETQLDNGEKKVRQRQCIAVGDGENYKKVKENPVITAHMLPEGSSLVDFRDPKMWIEDNKFYTVVGSRHQDTSGQIALFSSKDAIHWEFETILERCKNEYGSMWECPDFFPLGEKYILIASPQNMIAQGLEFHNGNNSMWIIGSYDKQEKRFERESIKAIDYGLDFYAPQTMETSDGRRVMIGWMQSWDNYMTPPDFQWSGMMTIPREITIRDGKLYQFPVKELENYHTNEIELSSIMIENETKTFESIKGRVVDLSVEIEEGDYEQFSIQIAKNEKFYTEICYEPNKQQLMIDRTYSGIDRDILCTRLAKVESDNGKIKLRILLDRYSVEVFVNDGELAMTNLIYTTQEAEEITFTSKGKVIANIIKCDVEVK